MLFRRIPVAHALLGSSGWTYVNFNKEALR